MQLSSRRAATRPDLPSLLPPAVRRRALEEGCEDLVRALERLQEGPSLTLTMAASARAVKDEKLALACADRALETHPDDRRSWECLWAAYAADKRWGELADRMGAAAKARAGNPLGVHYAGFASANAQRWIGHPNRWARRFAVALLWPLVKDKHWDNVPAALRVLGPAMKETDAEVRRAVSGVLAHLAPKSPAEISRFLLEQARYSNANTQWIIRNAMTPLGPEEQAAIVRAMRG